MLTIKDNPKENIKHQKRFLQPLDYLEEFEEMSVNVEQIASNIIMVSECEDN